MPFKRIGVMPSNKQGFTLIELLVVLLIMAVMGAVSYDMLGTSMRLESRTVQHSQALEQMTRTLHWLQQDIEQFIDRPIRDELGESEPSLLLQDGHLSLTHLGWANPLQEQRSNIQRVTYQLNNREFERMSWSVLDRDQDSKVVVQKLTNSEYLALQEVEISLLTASGWQTQWPLTKVRVSDEVNQEVPVAIRIRLASVQLGVIERTFELPGGVSEGTP